MQHALQIFLPSVTREELVFVASLDYGNDADRHLASLIDVLKLRGEFSEGDHYFPYEVVELGAHALTRDHEREFVLCTLLVMHAVASGFDSATDINKKFMAMASTYDSLSMDLRDLVLAAYLEHAGA